MKKILFIKENLLFIPPGNDAAVVHFYPGVFQFLARITREMDYVLVMITNPPNNESTSSTLLKNIVDAFKNEAIHFKEIIEENMFLHYRMENIDSAHSFFISNNPEKLYLPSHVCKKIYLGEKVDAAGPQMSGWEEIFRFLKSQPRTAFICRKTNETSISIDINLDGSGKSNISTGLGFFDHMLEQIARHGNIDLSITVQGDLNIDEHHTIEDVGLALGDAFIKALGSKKGIERYGFLLPMDDCLAQVAIDFGGRPWLVWAVHFNREKIGDMPTEMFMHFFKSFSDHAKCNLNIKAEGDNEHHKIEAIFKAFAKSISHAIQKTGNYNIPSTKGTL